MRSASQSGLFVLIVLLTCAVFAVSFPFVTRHVFTFPFSSYGGSGSRGQFYLILWIAAHVIGLFIYYLIFSWAFRQTARFVSAVSLRRIVLVLGAVLCCGYGLFIVWKDFSTGSNSMLLQRIVLSGFVLAVGGAALDAIRSGRGRHEDYTEYRSH